MSVRGILAYVALAAFWAGAFAGVKFAADSLGWALTPAILGVVGSVSLLLMAMAVGRRFDWRVDWGMVLLWAAFGTIIALSIAASAMYAGAAITAAVVSSIPLFDTVVAQMRGAERVTGIGAIGLILGVVGLLLVAAFPGGEPSWAFLGGVLASLLAAITAGSCGRFVASRLHRPQALETAILAPGLGGLVASLLVPMALPDQPFWLAVLVLLAIGVVGGFLALFALSSASESVPWRTAAALPGVGTVLAVLAAVLLLRESMSPGQMIGLILTLAGTALLRGLVPQWFPRSWRA